MSYSVKTIYYTIQGEGAQTGRAAVFLRFTGCNLWSGKEEQREKAICQFCDTDFLGVDGPGGGNYAHAEDLAAAAWTHWPKANGGSRPMVVCTGGEPLLQLNSQLIRALKDVGFEVAVETNGTRRAPDGIDWLCVSPKAGADFIQTSGNELKLVYPQLDLGPENLGADSELEFDHYYLQPMDGPNVVENTRLAVEYCLKHPRWRVSVQMHKSLGIA